MRIDSNENKGIITINKDVVAQIAHQSIIDGYGFVGFGCKNSGILELLMGDNLSRGVKIEENEDGTLDIEVYVVVQYGVNIESVSNNAIEKIKHNVETMSSLKVNKIVINVQGVRVQ